MPQNDGGFCDRESYMWVCEMLKRNAEKKGYGARPPDRMWEDVTVTFRAEGCKVKLQLFSFKLVTLV